jgi:hypothetical protein
MELNENYIIQFTRNKSEAYKLFFNINFKKALLFNLLRIILLSPFFYLIGHLFVASILVALDVEISNSLSTFFVVIFTLFFIFPFIKPQIELYRLGKKNIDDLYKVYNSITTIYEFSDSNIFCKNDLFEYKSVWENTKNLKIDKNYLVFQTISPNIYFALPVDSMKRDVIQFIKSKVIKN